MKVFLGVLFSAMIVFAVHAKDGERDYPTWFVVEQSENTTDHIQTTTPKAEEPSRELLSDVDKQEINPKRLKHKKSRFSKSENEQENTRFAKNNKDLLLAEKMLKLMYRNTDNFVVSPLSFYATSVLIANGVVDETLFEFSSVFPVLHLTEADKTLKNYVDTKKNSVSLHLALWSSAFSEHYKMLMKEYLNAELWGIADSTQIINDWLNAKTQGIIATYGEPEKADANSIYVSSYALFKENNAPFNVQNTSIRQFFNLDETVSNIKFLQGETIADYFENEDMQVLRLAYSNGDKLTLWLPNSDVDFDDFIETIDLNFLTPDFEREEVKVSLPEFDIEYTIKNAQEIYEALNIKRIFEKENYDFAKMISFDNPTKIKKVFNSSRIMVKENISEKSEEELSAKISFIADHPFIFMINNGDFIGVYALGKK